MTTTRRDLLQAALAATAATALPAMARAQGAPTGPTVEDVHFDPDIPVLGNRDGDVTVSEYFDYQCPYCKRGHDDLLDVVREDGNVRLVMKDWPIFGGPSVHAAGLVLAAGDRYGEGLNALMATPGRLSREDVDATLADAGFDPAALAAASQRDMVRIDGILARNMDQANAFGFRGTPAFVIGTRIYNGALDRRTLVEAIDTARRG